MGTRIVFKGSDFSVNAIEGIVTLANLSASDFEIGKLVSKADGTIIDSPKFAVSPMIDMPKGCAVYLNDISTYNIRVSIYDGNGVYLSDQNTSLNNEQFRSPTSNERLCKCRITLGTYGDIQMTEELLKAAIQRLVYIREISIAEKTIPVVLGIIPNTSDGVFSANNARATIGPIKYKGTVRALTGNINYVSYKHPYAATPENKIASASMAENLTSDGNSWLYIGYRNASSSTLDSEDNVLNDLVFE